MKRRHIVLVANDVGGVGGMEKHLEELIQRMKKDYPVTVVASSFRVQDPSGVRFIRIPTIRKPFPLMIAMFSVLASIRVWFMRDSIIHTTGAIVFNRVDVSTIHFCHAGYVRATGDNGANRNTWSYKLNAAISMRMKLWSERFCYRPSRFNHLVAVSSSIRDELETFYRYPSEDIEVVTNGVDIERFSSATKAQKTLMRRAKGFPEDGTYLIFMGGDWERKGLRLLLMAFDSLAGQYPNLHVVVVGAGDTEAFQELVSVTHRNRAHFPGRQPNPEDWYKLADIFVFPSQYEACSLAVLEGSSSGLAMILTNVGAARDVVEHGVSGYLVEPNVVDIMSRIQSLLDDSSTLNKFGENARARVRSMTWDDTYQRFKQVYESLLLSNTEVCPGHLMTE